MQPDIILNLQKEFLAEASSAPKLFRDLGKVEQYIAESYKTRSFIELIQNADDANSSTFGIYSMDDMLVVANDGRPFTINDIEALCRSGSSNKTRGGSTIGYRGIGFKSVVNLAKRIYVFSDDYKFYFDKSATHQLLPAIPDVPLIRVLHPYSKGANPLKIAVKLEKLASQHDYNTFFIFCDIDKRIVQQELQDFDGSSLLFLNNINQVICQADGVQRDISVTKQYRNNQRIVEIKEQATADSWNIISSTKDPRNMIAFKVKGDTIIPATQEESVVHSFTPTIEFAGAYIKINGDFSTDPSRKNIDFDDHSLRSFGNVLSMLVETVVNLLEGKIVTKGFFSPFLNVPNIEGNKFKGKLLKGLTEELKVRKLRMNGKRMPFSSLRLRPDWLNHEDYEKICNTGFCQVSKELLNSYPELPFFLDLVGVKRLYLNDVMANVNEADISVTGAAQITTKFISQNSHELTNEKVAEVCSLRLFPTGAGLVTSENLQSADDLKNGFVKYLTDHVSEADLKQFVDKANIRPGKIFKSLVTRKITPKIGMSVASTGQEATPDGNFIFKSSPNIHKWRSAEMNALEYLQALKGVLTVVDVSTANMGYDLEATLDSGRKIFIEIKSVSSFNESFKISNNEYSSAHNFGGSYFIGVVINEQPFQFRLIANPIKILSFQKQIERWAWYCDSYYDKLEGPEDCIKEIL